MTLHGDLEQQQRTTDLSALCQWQRQCAGRFRCRGARADIDSVDAVFNHGRPLNRVYLHRIGRTGRGGETGRAISLVADREMNRLHGIEAFMQQGPMSVLQLPDRAPTGPLPDPLFTTLEINGGRRHKLRPGDILGALTAHASITGAVVGKSIYWTNNLRCRAFIRGCPGATAIEPA